MAAVPGLSRLDDDVLGHICVFLDSTTNFTATAHLSRRWTAILRRSTAWSTLRLGREATARAEPFLRRHRLLQGVELTGPEDHILQALPNIHRLSLHSAVSGSLWIGLSWSASLQSLWLARVVLAGNWDLWTHGLLALPCLTDLTTVYMTSQDTGYMCQCAQHGTAIRRFWRDVLPLAKQLISWEFGACCEDMSFQGGRFTHCLSARLQRLVLRDQIHTVVSAAEWSSWLSARSCSVLDITLVWLPTVTWVRISRLTILRHLTHLTLRFMSDSPWGQRMPRMVWPDCSLLPHLVSFHCHDETFGRWRLDDSLLREDARQSLIGLNQSAITDLQLQNHNLPLDFWMALLLSPAPLRILILEPDLDVNELEILRAALFQWQTPHRTGVLR